MYREITVSRLINVSDIFNGSYCEHKKTRWKKKTLLKAFNRPPDAMSQ